MKFTEESILAARLIFEDCRDRRQDVDESFRKAIRRLILTLTQEEEDYDNGYATAIEAAAMVVENADGYTSIHDLPYRIRKLLSTLVSE